MSPQTERFVRRATRGLWGTARRAAQLELRGAVEDKVYRLRLLGLTEAEATERALRDLGSPARIAYELGAVHIAPQALKAALLTAMAGLLSFQAVAQTTTVRTLSSWPVSRCGAGTRDTAGMDARERALYANFLKLRGGQAGVQAQCRAEAQSMSDLIRVGDVLRAFRESGVKVELVAGTDAFYHLTFPGERQTVSLNLSGGITQASQGLEVMETAFLASILASQLPSRIPVRLEGRENPVLHVGPAKMRLGTASNPVQTTDLYLFPALEAAQHQWQDLGFQTSDGWAATFDYAKERRQSEFISAPGLPDGFYALALASGDGPPMLGIVEARGGRLPSPRADYMVGYTPDPQLVSSLTELEKVARQGKTGLLVFRLDVPDLRKLTLTPVAATGLRIQREAEKP